MTNLKITDKFKDSLYPILTFLAIIIVWQAVVEIKDIPQYILPTPIDIIKVFITDYQNLFDNTLVTLYETILGFILALLVALTLGIIMDFVSVIRKCLYPILVVSQTIPTITIAPLLIIWFGFEALPKILMVALTCFFPILISFVDGLENIDKVINIDQSPIGRTPRSNPATYTGVFDDIRDIFAETKEAKIRGYDKGRFSFNVKGGRCEACWGDGVKKIEMHFLPDVYVPCEVCNGTRYNSETLEIKYKDKNIYEVLNMRVDEAMEFFENHPKVLKMTKRLIHFRESASWVCVKYGKPA